MSAVVLERQGQRLRWRDRDGVLHAVEGANLISNDPGTFCLWARCADANPAAERGMVPGQLDVPANAAWLENGEPLECPRCRAIESRGAA